MGGKNRRRNRDDYKWEETHPWEAQTRKRGGGGGVGNPGELPKAKKSRSHTSCVRNLQGSLRDTDMEPPKKFPD